MFLFFYNVTLYAHTNGYTYIHNWPLQTFSQDYGLTSHTFHVVCVNFIREWRDLHLNVEFFEKLSIAFPKLIDSGKRSI